MIKNTETGEVVVGDYELVDDYEDWDYYYGDYSKLLNIENIETVYHYKRTKDYNVCLKPYSRIFSDNDRYYSFNNKKFSII